MKLIFAYRRLCYSKRAVGRYFVCVCCLRRRRLFLLCSRSYRRCPTAGRAQRTSSHDSLKGYSIQGEADILIHHRRVISNFPLNRRRFSFVFLSRETNVGGDQDVGRRTLRNKSKKRIWGGHSSVKTEFPYLIVVYTHTHSIALVCLSVRAVLCEKGVDRVRITNKRRSFFFLFSFSPFTHCIRGIALFIFTIKHYWFVLLGLLLLLYHGDWGIFHC